MAEEYGDWTDWLLCLGLAIYWGARFPSMAQKHSDKSGTRAFLRATGLATIFLAVAAMILTEYFWPATVLIFAGSAVLLLDAVFDRSAPRWLRATFVILVTLGMFLFARYVVWVDDPFRTSAMAFSVPQVNGKNPEINHSVLIPEIAIVDLILVNGSHGDYDDLRLHLTTDLWIRAMVQGTNHPAVEFQHGDEIPRFISHTKGVGNHFVARSADELQSKTWRVYCPKLRQGDSLEVLLGVVSTPPGFKVNGAPIEYGPMKIPKQLTVEAEYKGKFYRPRHYLITLDIAPP